MGRVVGPLILGLLILWIGDLQIQIDIGKKFCFDKYSESWICTIFSFLTSFDIDWSREMVR